MTSVGDLMYGGTGGVGGTPQRLGVGANGSLLNAASGAPAWLAPGANGALLDIASGAPAWLAPGTNGNTLAMVSGAPAWQSPTQLGVLTQVAATTTAGYTLVNGTGTILSWTSPNDGNMHTVIVMVGLNATSAQTGGVLALVGTLPNGTGFTSTFFGNQTGFHQTNVNAMVEANTTTTFTQNTAQTAGAAVLWAVLLAY